MSDQPGSGRRRMRQARWTGVALLLVAVGVLVVFLTAVLGQGARSPAADAAAMTRRLGLPAPEKEMVGQGVLQAIDDQQGLDSDLVLVLREHGVQEGDRLRIEFSFSAANEATARALQAWFARSTPYETSVQEPDADVDGWNVVGTTIPIPMTTQDLLEFDSRMVRAGFRFGVRDFDGYDVELPDDAGLQPDEGGEVVPDGEGVLRA